VLLSADQVFQNQKQEQEFQIVHTICTVLLENLWKFFQMKGVSRLMCIFSVSEITLLQLLT